MCVEHSENLRVSIKSVFSFPVYSISWPWKCSKPLRSRKIRQSLKSLPAVGFPDSLSNLEYLSKCGPQTGSLLEVHVLRSFSGTTKSASLGGPRILAFNVSCRWCSKLGRIASESPLHWESSSQVPTFRNPRDGASVVTVTAGPKCLHWYLWHGD